MRPRGTQWKKANEFHNTKELSSLNMKEANVEKRTVTEEIKRTGEQVTWLDSNVRF